LPDFAIIPTDQEVCVTTDTVTFEARPTVGTYDDGLGGARNVYFIWQVDENNTGVWGNIIDGGKYDRYPENGDSTTIQTTSTLKVFDLEANMSGYRYRCIISYEDKTSGVISCATASDPALLTVFQSPTPADADDIDLCNTTVFNLTGNTPIHGIGQWSVNSSTGLININSITNPTSLVTAQAGAYALTWTISNGECLPSADPMTINIAVSANAGSDISVCNATSTALNGNNPTWAHTSAQWTLQSPVAGATFGDATAYNTTVNNGLYLRHYSRFGNCS